jgi:GAF domain-containing protein
MGCGGFMPQVYYDLLFCLTFLVVLLIVVRFRKTAFKKEAAAYRKIVIGLLALTGFALIQLTGNQGLFSGVKYLEDQAGRDVISALCIAGGLMFLLSGIGAWLPSLTRYRDSRRQVNKRYFCLKMVNEAMDRGKSLDDTYVEILNCLSSYLGIRRCNLYKYSSRYDVLCLSASVGFWDKRQGIDDRIPLSDTALKKKLMRSRPLRTGAVGIELAGDDKPALLVPIAHQNRLYGTLFCWMDQNAEIDDDLIDFVSVAASLMGKFTYQHVTDIKKELYHSQQIAARELGEISNNATSVSDLVPDLFRVLRELVGAEYLSLASLDNSGENMFRYTIGSGGRLLLEKGVSRQTRGTDVYPVYETEQPIVDSRVIPDDKIGEQDGLFLSCGMRSRLTCPVKAGKKVVAVLTLGNTNGGHFTAYHLHRLNQVLGSIAGAIQREQLNRSLEAKEDHMLRLQLMQGQLADNSEVPSFFNDACELLTRRMKCTVARISLLNRDRNLLVSQACRSIRETGNNLKEKDTIPLSLLPWHRMTLDAKKLMLINQDDPESQMPPQESTSALIPSIKSAMLVPIMLNDQVTGVISVGEARNWNRRAFGASDLIFAKDVAAKCSVALRLQQLEYGAEKSREQINRLALSGDESWPEVKARLKSPLTSIIGAAELLRLKGTGDEFSTRYFDLILKSADRIKSITDEDPRRTEDMIEVEPEQVIG